MSLRVMHVFVTQLRPHNTRHLNALYLPQFLGHLSLKTSHTPTFKPTARCWARCGPLPLWSHVVQLLSSSWGDNGGVRPLAKWSRLRHSPATLWAMIQALRKAWGKGATGVGSARRALRGGGPCDTKQSRRRKANSHIWRHHGGSLEEQLARM